MPTEVKKIGPLEFCGERVVRINGMDPEYMDRPWLREHIQILGRLLLEHVTPESAQPPSFCPDPWEGQEAYK